MLYGICNLSIIPLRSESSEASEMVSQLLFGEHFKVLEKRKNWSKVRLHFDGYEGYLDNKQFIEIDEENYNLLSNSETVLSSELIDFITDSNSNLSTICIGSRLPFYNNKKIKVNTEDFTYEGNIINKKLDKELIIDLASKYENDFSKKYKPTIDIENNRLLFD